MQGEIGVGRLLNKSETTGHHTDDRKEAVIQVNLPSNHIGVGARGFSPYGVAKHDRRRRSTFHVVTLESAAQSRGHSQHAKEILGHSLRAQPTHVILLLELKEGARLESRN